MRRARGGAAAAAQNSLVVANDPPGGTPGSAGVRLATHYQDYSRRRSPAARSVHCSAGGMTLWLAPSLAVSSCALPVVPPTATRDLSEVVHRSTRAPSRRSGEFSWAAAREAHDSQAGGRVRLWVRTSRAQLDGHRIDTGPAGPGDSAADGRLQDSMKYPPTPRAVPAGRLAVPRTSTHPRAVPMASCRGDPRGSSRPTRARCALCSQRVGQARAGGVTVTDTIRMITSAPYAACVRMDAAHAAGGRRRHSACTPRCRCRPRVSEAQVAPSEQP